MDGFKVFVAINWLVGLPLYVWLLNKHRTRISDPSPAASTTTTPATSPAPTADVDIPAADVSVVPVDFLATYRVVDTVPVPPPFGRVVAGADGRMYHKPGCLGIGGVLGPQWYDSPLSAERAGLTRCTKCSAAPVRRPHADRSLAAITPASTGRSRPSLPASCLRAVADVGGLTFHTPGCQRIDRLVSRQWFDSPLKAADAGLVPCVQCNAVVLWRQQHASLFDTIDPDLRRRALMWMRRADIETLALRGLLEERIADLESRNGVAIRSAAPEARVHERIGTDQAAREGGPHQYRERGRYGSYPSHDDYSDDASP